MGLGDALFGLVGLIMAAMILHRNSSLRRLPWRANVKLALIWAAIFVGCAVIASSFI